MNTTAWSHDNMTTTGTFHMVYAIQMGNIYIFKSQLIVVAIFSATNQRSLLNPIVFFYMQMSDAIEYFQVEMFSQIHHYSKKSIKINISNSDILP